ncbi:MAG: hypothetical protein PHH82_02200 [Candidatus ainarchaeum sp.]|nr:hypothetical protein [Candidatus ainarchaeum sp.]
MVKKQADKETGFLQGLLYGLIPHAGCIAFVLFSIFGATAAASIFRPLLLKSYFFYGLLGLSFLFATISAIFYLSKHKALSAEGVKKRWKYLSILYGTTISINLLLFFVVFPYAVNLSAPTIQVDNVDNLNTVVLNVDIPCSGHAPLITTELYGLQGITKVDYSIPTEFKVQFDSSKISKTEILSLEIFKEFKATEISS